MAIKWLSDQMAVIKDTQGIAVAGLGGAPAQNRSTQVLGRVKIFNFTVEQATPNPMPGSPAGSIISGDSIIIAELDPTDWIYFGRIYWNAWAGTSILMSVGKYDPNGAAGISAAHYLAAQDIDTAGTADLDVNIPEQAGLDPKGDQSAGNMIPEFGAAKVQIALTFAASAFGSGGTVSGFLMVVTGGN